MEDKMIDDLKKWQRDTQDMFNNLTNFVNGVKKDLTPEEREMIDKEMEKMDTKDLQAEMDKITQQLNEQMSKFKV
jgi:hypothetical protein